MPKSEEDHVQLKTKKLEFPRDIMNQIERYLSRKTLEIQYYNGHMVTSDKSNLSFISPHKILLKSDTKEIAILYYGDYHYDENLFYINEATNPCTFAKLRELVNIYF